MYNSRGLIQHLVQLYIIFLNGEIKRGANLKGNQTLLVLKPGEWWLSKKQLVKEAMQKVLGTERCNEWGEI